MQKDNRYKMQIVVFSSSILYIISSVSAWNIQPNINTQRRPRYDHFKISMISPDQVTDVIQQVSDTAANIDVNEEAALLNDLAEVSEDMLVLVAPETIILRLGAVIGRVLELLSDYLPEQSIRNDELLVNVPLFSAALFLLSRSAIPRIRAQFIDLNEQDKWAYYLCFKPVGLTLLQFKGMKALDVFEWIECKPGEVLIDEKEWTAESLKSDNNDDSDKKTTPTAWKYLYWQSDGEVERSFRGKTFGSLKRRNGKHIDNQDAQGILGVTRFLYFLEEENRRQYGGSTTSEYQFHPIDTITVGPKGARLLRIDSFKLFDLMDHDQR